MSFIPSLFRVLTGAIVLLGASLFLNISVDTESSQGVLAMGAQAKEKCITVNGKRVCLEEGAKKKNAKKKDDDDDRGKGEKTNGDDAAELTECTIIGAGGGGGCKNGKWTCEKMKSGKKCCGCVAAKPVGTDDTQPEKDTQAKTQVDTQNKAEERFSVGTDAVPPAQGGETTPSGTLLLPYFENDLSKPKP